MPQRHQKIQNTSLSYSEKLYSSKVNRYALVIPVINEGERLQNQLDQLRKAEFPIDIIISDGGSTDCSLIEDFIETTSVRAVLTKLGTGKLSTQLRIGYAWCLDQEYIGVITMDGNGKDDINGIPGFIEMLERGYDFVQGSRFISGGISENTPMHRSLAIRFIHAPLINLSSGFTFTDTTNGFRGYSCKLLQNEELGIFRDIFDSYNLLFYISAQASKHGLSCVEVPVRRRYPADGKIPTKIDSLTSKATILLDTIKAVVGVYNNC